MGLFKFIKDAGAKLFGGSAAAATPDALKQTVEGHGFDASKLNAPDISFWPAWNGSLLVGCAALKELSSTEGEIKSMRTPSAMRRTGAGRALLNHIIDVARSRGYRVLYRETGRHPGFLPAQTLYRGAGFKLCGPFGSYRDNGNSVFMSLSLKQSAT